MPVRHPTRNGILILLELPDAAPNSVPPAHASADLDSTASRGVPHVESTFGNASEEEGTWSTTGSEASYSDDVQDEEEKGH